MVVRFGFSRHRGPRRDWQQLARLTGLLVIMGQPSIVVQPSQPGGLSPFPQTRPIEGSLLSSELRALGTLPTQLQPTSPSWNFTATAAVPGLQPISGLRMNGVDQVLWDSALQGIGDLSWDAQSGPAPASLAAPSPDALRLPGFATDVAAGSTAHAAAVGGGVINAGAAPNPNLAVLGQIDDQASMDSKQSEPSVMARYAGASPENLQTVCDSQIPAQFQSGGEFWSTQGTSAIPVQVSSPQFSFAAYGNVAGPGQTDLGPFGTPSNLAAPGPEIAWCQAPPVPFYMSSPLARRAFWTPFALLLVGIAVLWSSRGIRLPRM